MSIYKNNLAILKDNSTELYSSLLFEDSKNPVELEPVEGQNNYIMQSSECRCFMHSIYDNRRELDEMFSGVNKDAECIVVFGAGLGHFITYIEENYKKIKKIFIIEPSIEIFRRFLENVDLYAFIKKFEDVTFIVNKSSIDASSILISMLRNYIKSNLEFAFSLSYRSIFPVYYETIHNNTIEYFRSYRVNNATAELFQDKWLVNVMRNIKQDETPVEALLNKFNEGTALLVSAGPSLNENIELIKKINKNIVIIAVGSAIKILHSNNIKPHLRFAIDGSYGQTKIFDGVDTSICPLVHSNLSFYDIPKNYKADKVRMVLETDYLTMYILKLAGIDFNLIPSGNSVANVALSTLCKMGFRKIIFVGQDLCYTHGELYARGSWKQESINEEKIKNGELVKTENVNGENVYTNLAFLGMKKGFESCISEYPDIEFINSTVEGLHIKGTILKDLQEVLENNEKNNISTACNINKLITSNKIQNYEDKINGAISRLKEELLRLVKLNDEKIKCIPNNFANSEGCLLEKTVKQIRECDRKMNKIGAFNEAISSLLAIKFSAIYHGFFYRGDDVTLKNKSLLKIALNEAMVLREYLDFLKFLIEEFNGERILNIEYDE